MSLISRAAQRRSATKTSLHAAVVELIALDDAEIKYSTVQNWYPGDKRRQGWYLQLRHQARRLPRRNNSKISWTQVETGSAITWKYPSCILRGDNSRGEFYSIAVSNGRQQIDSGTKMLHLGRNTSSRIISKGICGRPLRTTLIAARSRRTGKAEQCPQFHPVRLAADRQQLRRTHGAVYRGQERHGTVRARGNNLEDLGRSAVLLHAARHSRGRGHRPDRQWIRQRCDPGTADGICRRSTETHWNQFGRKRRLDERRTYDRHQRQPTLHDNQRPGGALGI